MSSCIRQHLRTKISSPKPGRVLTIYMEKLEILVGKSSGLLCSVWEALENMGCNLKRSIFLLILVCSANLDILCSGLLSHHVKYFSFMFMHKISTQEVCVNGKHPGTWQ